jgi:hypothetical protein
MSSSIHLESLHTFVLAGFEQQFIPTLGKAKVEPVNCLKKKENYIIPKINEQ